MEVLTDIPVDITPEKVFKRLRMRRENETIASGVRELLDATLPLVNPKAVYECSYVDRKEDDSLHVGGIKFTSQVLRGLLAKVHRAFPFVTTCGREIEEVQVPGDDALKSFLMDAIKEEVLVQANRHLRHYIADKFALGQTSTLAPGSLKDWPITQQRQLFSIFGDVEGLIGVRLAPSFLMTPIKSTSGILFPTEVRFESCQLCPMESCVGRRAPYDPELVKQYQEKALDGVG